MGEMKDGDLVAIEQTDILKGEPETTVIRISSTNYERLRQMAFYERSTIRQVADDILTKELRE